MSICAYCIDKYSHNTQLVYWITIVSTSHSLDPMIDCSHCLQASIDTFPVMPAPFLQGLHGPFGLDLLVPVPHGVHLCVARL